MYSVHKIIKDINESRTYEKKKHFYLRNISQESAIQIFFITQHLWSKEKVQVTGLCPNYRKLSRDMECPSRGRASDKGGLTSIQNHILMLTAFLGAESIPVSLPSIHIPG